MQSKRPPVTRLGFICLKCSKDESASDVALLCNVSDFVGKVWWERPIFCDYKFLCDFLSSQQKIKIRWRLKKLKLGALNLRLFSTSLPRNGGQLLKLIFSKCKATLSNDRLKYVIRALLGLMTEFWSEIFVSEISGEGLKFARWTWNVEAAKFCSLIREK